MNISDRMVHDLAKYATTRTVHCDKCGQQVPADEEFNPLSHDCSGVDLEDEVLLPSLDFDQTLRGD